AERPPAAHAIAGVRADVETERAWLHELRVEPAHAPAAQRVAVIHRERAREPVRACGSAHARFLAPIALVAFARALQDRVNARGAGDVASFWVCTAYSRSAILRARCRRSARAARGAVSAISARQR